MRIHVTGNAGAGKTTLARELGEALGLPVFSLDSIVWRPGWQKTPPEERSREIGALIDRPAWVIDGVSPMVRQASDVILFLDVPRGTCAWRGLKRNLRYFTRTRPGLPTDCPEWRILPRLMKIIWRFPADAGAEIRRDAALDPRRYRIMRHAQQGSDIFDELSDVYGRRQA